MKTKTKTKTKTKISILFIFVFSMFVLNVNAFANITTINENDFKIMGAAQQDGNNIKLDWTELKNANYQIYQSVDGSDFQTMSTFDTTSGTDKVKVLQIYPDVANGNVTCRDGVKLKDQLKSWVVDSGYGKGHITVDSIDWNSFKANPNNYLKSNNVYQYDVIVFGIWDSNNGYPFDATMCQAVIDFINSGRGCILTHDTIGYTGTAANTLSMMVDTYNFDEYFGFSKYWPGTTTAPETKIGGYSSSTRVIISKSGLFTTYPNYVGKVGESLIIPYTHTMGLYVTDGDIWIKFSPDANGGAVYPGDNEHRMGFPNANGYYEERENALLWTKNNCAVICTGDSSGAASEDEKRIFTNLLFYCDQLTEKTTFVDNSGQDFASPNKPNIKIDANNNKLLLEAIDNGTTYQYKAKAYVGNESIESDPISVENKSGIKGFYYLINENPNEQIIKDTGNFTTNAIDLLSITSDTNYLHIAAVDNANNVSETTSLSMDDIIGINASNIAYTINTTNDTTNVDLSIVASGVNVNYQWEMKTENSDWQEIDNATLEEHSMDITNMNELLYYRCRVYNNSLSMYSNEVVVNPTTYDKTYVYVTQASTFSVKIPKVMILSGQTGKGEYVVSVNGNVSGLASVNVTPNDFAIMKDMANVKTSFNAFVTQDKTLFNANEIINGTTTNGLVDGSAHMTAGSWKGNFNFAIDFEDEKSKVNSIASVNQNDDGTTIGYDKEQEQSTAYSHISFVN